MYSRLVQYALEDTDSELDCVAGQTKGRGEEWMVRLELYEIIRASAHNGRA